ncbi:redoxin domain-containing protein [Bacillus sp. APMAM]|uniref:TlpA family protein disulfide reductase n=1 Tax=Margalitia sp. FSL K6-0131 TaxID=2954604 RepID=UPI000F88C90E|nr:redoxin domain-containing protein [Bacillus sp. APMAM]RTZ56668.1 redoxin domain-containing protein [Bacillus sp. SAJ1]
MEWNSFILLAVLILLVAELGVLYYFVKFNKNFLKQIKSVNGLEFATLHIGQMAPLFRTFDENGNKVISKHLFNEKHTVLLFISTHCPKCKALLQQIENAIPKYDINFVIINSDENAEDSHIKSLLKGKFTYVRSSQISQLYFIQNVPYAVVIDNDGKVELSSYLSNINSLYNLLINQKPLAV